jgi:hypothetical protein
MLKKTYFRLLIYLSIWQLYLIFMQSHAPLGTDWLPWHFQRIYNFSEYLKLNGYFSNYGFSIWSICKDCSLDAGYEENKIYLSLYIFSNLPYVIINHYFGVENLKLYGHLVDKVFIFITGSLIAELLLKLSKNKTKIENYTKAILCFSIFIITPWTYKMLIGQWSIFYFLAFYLIGIFLFLNKKHKLGLLLFFISGMFDYQSSAGVGTFYTLLLIIFSLKREKNLNKYFFLDLDNNKLLNYKIAISLILPACIYFFLRFLAENELQIVAGSSILTRIGISGNDVHNGSLLGALQFLGGNRITQCLAGFNIGLDLNDFSKSIFVYNCALSHASMFLVSLISMIGIFILYKKNNSFFKLIAFPILFLLSCYIFILQQSSSVHLMGYSYLFSLLFSVGITSVIFKILEKYNFSTISILLITPATIGILLLCIRISMLTGANG